MDYDKYEKYGDLHWQWYNDPKHLYRELVDQSLEPFREVKEIGTLVDIGCGDGVSMHWLNLMGFKCAGVDPSEAGVKIALMQHNVEGEYFIEKAEGFEKREMEFDYLYSLNTIEHLDNPAVMVKIMKRIKKFGVIVTDNDDTIESSKRSVYHNTQFSPTTLEDLFKGFGMERIKINHPDYFGYKIWNL